MGCHAPVRHRSPHKPFEPFDKFWRLGLRQDWRSNSQNPGAGWAQQEQAGASANESCGGCQSDPYSAVEDYLFYGLELANLAAEYLLASAIGTDREGE
ncbi:hypothetical protein D9M70_547980 [compost metagenome]